MFSSQRFFTGLMMVAVFVAIGCAESTAPVPEDLTIERVDRGIVVNYAADKSEMLNGYKKTDSTFTFIDSLFPVPNEFIQKGRDTLTMALFMGGEIKTGNYSNRERATELMKKSGYRPANAYELFHYAKLSLPIGQLKSYQGIIAIVAIGTKKQGGIDGETNSGVLIYNSDSTRELSDVYLFDGRDYLLGVAIK